jgi:hypothetical protein
MSQNKKRKTGKSCKMDLVGSMYYLYVMTAFVLGN